METRVPIFFHLHWGLEYLPSSTCTEDQSTHFLPPAVETGVLTFFHLQWRPEYLPTSTAVETRVLTFFHLQWRPEYLPSSTCNEDQSTYLLPPAMETRVGNQSVAKASPDHVMLVFNRPGALRTV